MNETVRVFEYYVMFDDSLSESLNYVVVALDLFLDEDIPPRLQTQVEDE